MTGKEKPGNNPVGAFIEAIGAVSEMTLLFYRNLVRAGATIDEATHCTQAFIAVSVFSGNNAKDREG